MPRLCLYPAFERQQDLADALSDLCWWLGPVAETIDEIRLFAPFGDLPRHPSPARDPSPLASASGRILLDRARLRLPPASPRSWRTAARGADRVLVWRVPDGGPATLKPFLGEVPLLHPDGQGPGAVGQRLADWGLTLLPDREALVERCRQRFLSLKGSIGAGAGYLLGEASALDEAERYGLGEGPVLAEAALAADPALIRRLQPAALAAGDPERQTGASAGAAAFRRALAEAMQDTAFRLVLPLADSLPLIAGLPEAYRERVIGVPPLKGGALSLDLEHRFGLPQLGHPMTQVLLPLAASLFRTLYLCGPATLDGLPPAARENCEADLERLCQAMEETGRQVVALTRSHLAPLRRRGAAPPGPPAQTQAAGPTGFLSVTPDLMGRTGHFWNYERHLGPKIAALGHPYRIAANTQWGEAQNGEADGLAGVALDCCLYTPSWTFADRPGDSESYRASVRLQVMGELRQAVARALAAQPGPLRVYLYSGSLPHAEALWEIAREEPRLSLQVNLFWLRSEEVGEPGFLDRWRWLLEIARDDPRLTLTCMSAHQAKSLQAVCGTAFAAAPHPSPLIDDERARALVGRPPPQARPRRIFFPSTSRREKGFELVYETARLLVERAGAAGLELIFRNPPFDPAKPAESDPLFPFTTLLPGPTDEALLIETLSSCRAVVLPYLPPTFADRTSGLAVDALYCGVPSVVVAGTSLAELAEACGCGLVVTEASPEALAEATLRLLEAPEPWDFRAAARDYLAANSWQGLAEGMVAALPPAAPPPPAAAGRQRPLALIGPQPREDLASSDELAALLLCLTDREPVLVEAAAGESAETIRAKAGRADPAVSVLVGGTPGETAALLALAEALHPLAVLVAFDDEAGVAHAPLADRLEGLGYRVLLSEQQPRLRPGEPPLFRQLLAAPCRSDLPWARGWLLALPPATPLAAVKAAFLESGRDLGYREIEDRREVALGLWQAAAPLAPERLAAAAATPGGTWRLAGLELTGRRLDGFARLTETPPLRLHRSLLAGRTVAGQPLTVAVDVAPLCRRFLSLGLVDAQDQPLSEAVFDLADGRLIKAHSFLDGIEPFVAAVPLGWLAEDEPAYRLWLSIERYPQSHEVRAQLAPLAGALGAPRYKGDPDCGVMARNFLMELNPTPSLFPPRRPPRRPG